MKKGPAAGADAHLPRTAAKIQEAVTRRCAPAPLLCLPRPRPCRRSDLPRRCTRRPRAAAAAPPPRAANRGAAHRLPAGWPPLVHGPPACACLPLRRPRAAPCRRRSSQRLTLAQRIDEAISRSASVTPTVSRSVTPATETLRQAAAAAAALGPSSPAGGSPAGGSPKVAAAPWTEPAPPALPEAAAAAAAGQGSGSPAKSPHGAPAAAPEAR